MFGVNFKDPSQWRVPGCGGGSVGVQACIMSVGMQGPYMSLWESHLTEVHCERAK